MKTVGGRMSALKYLPVNRHFVLIVLSRVCSVYFELVGIVDVVLLVGQLAKPTLVRGLHGQPEVLILGHIVAEDLRLLLDGHAVVEVLVRRGFDKPGQEHVEVGDVEGDAISRLKSINRLVRASRDYSITSGPVRVTSSS